MRLTEYRSQRILCGDVHRDSELWGQWEPPGHRHSMKLALLDGWIDGWTDGWQQEEQWWGTHNNHTNRVRLCRKNSKGGASVTIKNKDEMGGKGIRFEFKSIQTFPSLPLCCALSRNRLRTQDSNSGPVTEEWGISIHTHHHHQQYHPAARLWSNKSPELEVKNMSSSTGH